MLTRRATPPPAPRTPPGSIHNPIGDRAGPPGNGYIGNIRLSETAIMLNGSCLCGRVAYTVDGPLADVVNCHCAMCRKAHGAAFRTRATVRAEHFAFVRGESDITWYSSSPGNYRGFCSACGTRCSAASTRRPMSTRCPWARWTTTPASRRPATSTSPTRRRGTTSRMTSRGIPRAAPGTE